MSNMTKPDETGHKEHTERHQLMQDELSKKSGEAGANSSMGYPTDERLNTEMVGGGSPVISPDKDNGPRFWEKTEPSN